MQFLPHLLYINVIEMVKFKFIRAQEDYTTFPRKNHSRSGNPKLHTKPLKFFRDLYGDYDGRNKVIVDDSM